MKKHLFGNSSFPKSRSDPWGYWHHQDDATLFSTASTIISTMTLLLRRMFRRSIRLHPASGDYFASVGHPRSAILFLHIANGMAKSFRYARLWISSSDLAWAQSFAAFPASLLTTRLRISADATFFPHDINVEYAFPVNRRGCHALSFRHTISPTW